MNNRQTLSRRELIHAAAGLAALGIAPAAVAQTTTALPSEMPAAIDLWPDGPPGAGQVTVTQASVARTPGGGPFEQAVMHVTRPTLTPFLAPQPNGGAVLMIPGGGYKRVVVGKEGYEIARELNRHGLSVFVLLYRLPADGWAAGPDAPLQDAQRAMRLIRSRATEFGIDPARVAVQGFSAGGHLAARLGTRFKVSAYDAIDAIDQQSARPDLMALGYPVISMRDGIAHIGSRNELLGHDPSPARQDAWSAETAVPADAPPAFLFAAADDATVPIANTLAMFTALHQVGVAAEMHVFERGGHGFALRDKDLGNTRDWPALFQRWADMHGLSGAT